MSKRSLYRHVVVAASVVTVAIGATVVMWPAQATEQSPAKGSSSVWADTPVGFAAVAGNGVSTTTGGAAGRVVTASNLADLKTYASATEPLVVKVVGSITVAPFGDMVEVSSDKTIVGEGAAAELVGGGLFLKGSHNVIIRNLTIRDSYIPGDWPGKSSDNDNDGIRMDTAHHVWVDHTRIERVGDGGIDIRKDTDYVTLSWNIVSDINKAMGIGWTTNVITKMTAHHNWIRNTYQRNWSVDNTAAAHLFNNYLHNIGSYGTMSRGAAKVVVENSVFDHVNEPLIVKDPASELVQRGNLFIDSNGSREAVGQAFDPSTFYPYVADPAKKVATRVSANAGPTRATGTPRASRTITVALDGSGDYASLQAALGATRDVKGPATIVVRPGTYKEVVWIWNDQSDVTIRGATGNPTDVVITYDQAAKTEIFYGGPTGLAGSSTLTVMGNNVTIRDLTVENSYNESTLASPAPAVRTVGDRVVFDNTRFIGDEGTYVADTPDLRKVTRTYLRHCYIEGNLDFITGRGTAVFDGCTIFSKKREGTDTAGWITAASTSDTNPYGFLFTGSTFTSDAANRSIHLGHPLRPESDPRAVAQVLVRDCVLGAHIADSPWTDATNLPWHKARLSEYHNTGPGATVNAQRPQLTTEVAAKYTPQAYLNGNGTWRP